MTLQYSGTLRTNQAAQLQATVGTSGVLKIFSGSEPVNCASADPTGLLCTIPLPSTFLTSSGGVTALAGTWQANASSAGTAASFRIYDGSAVCHMQGTCTTDLVLINTNIAVGQTVQVTSFGVTVANA